MKRLLLLLLLIATFPAVLCAQPSQVDVARSYIIGGLPAGTPTNYVLVSGANNVPRVFSVDAYNTNLDTSTKIYLLLVDTNGAPAVGARPVYVVRINGDTTGGQNFDISGAPFTNGLCAVVSTNALSVTNGGGVGALISVRFNNRPK